MAIKTTINQATGTSFGAKVNKFPKAQQTVIADIIDTLNNVIDGSISTTDLTISGDLVVGDDATITGDLIVGNGSTITGAIIDKRTNTSIATGATATAVSVVGGYLSVTGGTGNVTLPTAAQITTAIGSTPVGTTIDFMVNVVGMTAGNALTILVGDNIKVQKMISAGDIATDQLLTLANTAGLNMGIFRICYITPTTCSIHRLA